MRTSAQPGSRPSIVRYVIAAVVIAAVCVAPAFHSAPAARTPQPPSAAQPTVVPGVVQIQARNSYSDLFQDGAGIVLAPGDVVLTVYHVVAFADSIEVRHPATGTTHSARLLGYNRLNDVALLQLPGGTGLPPVPIGDRAALEIGDEVVSLGSSAGYGRPFARRGGKVTDLGVDAGSSDEYVFGSHCCFIESDNDVDHGDSGGPLLNSAGQVVGLTDLGNRWTTKSYALEIDLALEIVDDIRSGRKSARTHVGPPTSLGIGIDWARDGTAVVREVFPGGPAAATGLAVGDVILKLGRSDVAGQVTQLVYVLDISYPGPPIPLTWVDPAGRQHTALVTLVAGPDGSGAPAPASGPFPV